MMSYSHTPYTVIHTLYNHMLSLCQICKLKNVTTDQEENACTQQQLHYYIIKITTDSIFYSLFYS